MGFDDVSDDRRASAIAQYVLGILQKFNCVEKLVAQTYDGASVMSPELNGVQAKIKEDVPEAIFLHCYAHKLNLVLLHSAKCMPECKAFFKTLKGLSAFFSKSTKRTYLSDNVVKLVCQGHHPQDGAQILDCCLYSRLLSACTTLIYLWFSVLLVTLKISGTMIR